MSLPRAALLAVVVAALAAAAGLTPRRARADDVSVRLEPGYAASDLTTVDAAGFTYRSRSQTILQRYRLTADRRFSERLRLSLGGIFDQLNGEQTLNAVRTSAADRRTNLWGTLGFGDRTLGGQLGYTRRDERPDLRLDALARRTEIVSGNVGWNPDDLPKLTLRASRTARFAGTASSPYQTILQSMLGAGWVPVPGVDLRYSLAVTDVASRVDTLEMLNTARASYSGKAFGGRSTVQASYDLGYRTAEISAAPGDLIATRQLPLAGLSLVESALTSPESARLDPNPALVDGNVASPTALNVGYGPSSRADTWRRHVGAEMADGATPVNLFHLYVDRPLDPVIASLYTFAVYQSIDNQVWTEVALEPRGGLAVRYEELESRFELRFVTVRARYVKLVVRPLPVGATIDPALADVFLTELQTFEEQEAGAVDTRTSGYSQRIGTAMRTRLVRGHDLAWDYAGNATHASADGRARTTWFLENGLQYGRQLARTLAFTSRVSRFDYSQGQGGHEGGFNYGASLAATPLPTLAHVLTYSGSALQGVARDAVRNSMSLSNRADLYDGVSLAVIGSYSVDVSWPGGTTRSALGSASATVTPHRTTTLTGSYSLTDTRQELDGDRSTIVGRLPGGRRRLTRAEGNVNYAPFSALFVSGGVAQVRTTDTRPQNLYSFSTGFSPFQGGDLQLRFSYVETFDEASDGRTRVVSPGLRWKIRRGTFFEVAYVATDTRAPVASTRGRTFTANLIAPIW